MVSNAGMDGRIEVIFVFGFSVSNVAFMVLFPIVFIMVMTLEF
jgi:hypothetical protein